MLPAEVLEERPQERDTKCKYQCSSSYPDEGDGCNDKLFYEGHGA